MGATGSANLSFGAFASSTFSLSHRETEASVAITGQGSILSTSLVEAWIRATTASADHSVDEHRIENIKVVAGDIVPATGFTIYGECLLGGTYGTFAVNWAWI